MRKQGGIPRVAGDEEEFEVEKMVGMFVPEHVVWRLSDNRFERMWVASWVGYDDTTEVREHDLVNADEAIAKFKGQAARPALPHAGWSMVGGAAGTPAGREAEQKAWKIDGDFIKEVFERNKKKRKLAVAPEPKTKKRRTEDKQGVECEAQCCVDARLEQARHKERTKVHAARHHRREPVLLRAQVQAPRHQDGGRLLAEAVPGGDP